MVMKPGLDVSNNPSKAASASASVHRTQSCIDLFDAIGESNIEEVIRILQNTADAEDLLRKKDLQGLTPLRKAVALSQGEMTRILVSHGADPGQMGARDKVALHEAARLGQRTLLAPLLTSEIINAKDKDGMTPLHYAVKGRHVKTTQWLLFGGADVTIKNLREQTPLDLCNKDSENERDRHIFHMLKEQSRHKPDAYQPVLSCGYIEQKQLTRLGPDKGLMIVTSGLWSQDPQFIFIVQVFPENNMYPPIPLRQDEIFYSDLFRYKMMRKLDPEEKRVKIYFSIQEQFTHSELILKVTSKTKYLGELALALTRYSHDHYYINFLVSSEFDLQNEGQFVLVKRPRMVKLLPGADDALTADLEQYFKLRTSENTFPDPPPSWQESRRQKEWDEAQAMIEILEAQRQSLAEAGTPPEEAPEEEHATAGGHERDANQSHVQTKQISSLGDKNTNAATTAADPSVKDDEGTKEEDEEEEEEDEKMKPGDILEWDEEDECDDFFFISRGWGLFLETRRTLNSATIMSRYVKDVEEPMIRAFTHFYRVHHPSKEMFHQCLCQFPKHSDWVKTGTVLVFQRQELQEDEVESPDPDDRKEEFFMSEDGKHTHGWVWLNNEMKRWTLIQKGIVNRRTRIIFEMDKLNVYIGVQLFEGEEEWELETDDSESEEESEEEFGEDGEPIPTQVGAEGEEAEEKHKKKKKKKKKGKGGEGEDDGEERSQTALAEQSDEEEKGQNKSENNRNRNTNQDEEGEREETETVYQGLQPITSSFALGVDDEFQTDLSKPLEEAESLEDLGEPEEELFVSAPLREKNHYTMGPDISQFDIAEDILTQLRTEIAIMWRYRNHREAQIMIFTRPRKDLCFDLIIEIVQMSDLDVRAEYRWIEKYKLIGISSPFPTKTGRLFGFAIEGTMTILTPSDIHMRTVFFSAIKSNFLTYVVRRPAPAQETQQQPKGKVAASRALKRKENFAAESTEVDGNVEVTAYPKGTDVDGMDITSLDIRLTGPNLWLQRHREIRAPDEALTNSVIEEMVQEPNFTKDWWKVWILLDYGEKAIDVEKVKQDWPGVSRMMLTQWFADNLDSKDRGVCQLFYLLETLRLHDAADILVAKLKSYKALLQAQTDQPRQLDLLFHWVLRTKMTRSNLMRITSDPQVIRPLSEAFLLRFAELLDPEKIFEIGASLEVEDNVLNSITGEEYITDPLYKLFKVLMRCRQKKDEIVGFILLLLGMVQAMSFEEAQNFISTETRRWMKSVARKEAETCAKLENILPQS